MIKEQKFKIIDSTINEAQRQLQTENPPKEDFVIRAEFQTDGRGQRGNTWEAQNAANLTFSYVFFPLQMQVKNQFQISQAAALSVVEFLKKNSIENVSIKWPNDIVCSGKKICGMLIENSVSGHYIKSSIIGIGINVNQSLFRENLPNPVSMTNITGKFYNLDEKFYEVVSILRQRLSLLKEGDFAALKEEYMSNLLGLNRTLIYSSSGTIFKGVIKDVDQRGYITIFNENTLSESKYAFNEVNLIIPEQKKNVQ